VICATQRRTLKLNGIEIQMLKYTISLNFEIECKQFETEFGAKFPHRRQFLMNQMLPDLSNADLMIVPTHINIDRICSTIMLETPELSARRAVNARRLEE
jgi:hypothetical protein